MIESILDRMPVLGICGYSGAGKTTLLEKLLPLLRADGLAVAVIKHDAHGLQLDRPGKDTDRLFNAGATVLAHCPSQGFLRLPIEMIPSLPSAIELLLRQHDVVLVEGHKSTALPAKIWLCSEGESSPPESDGPFAMVLGRDDDRVKHTHKFLRSWLRAQSRRTPVRGGILVGSEADDLSPDRRERFWSETIGRALTAHVDSVTLLGSVATPAVRSNLNFLPAVPDNQGPFARMLAALRWDPWCQWLFVTGDPSFLSSHAIQWLLDQRGPGTWAILPKPSIADHAEPSFALYDWRARGILETAREPEALSMNVNIHCPIIPKDLRKDGLSRSTSACSSEMLAVGTGN